MAKTRSRRTLVPSILLALAFLLGTVAPGMAWFAPPEQYHVEEGWPEEGPQLTELDSREETDSANFDSNHAAEDSEYLSESILSEFARILRAAKSNIYQVLSR